ncbi:hypothetical protein [Frigoribacterium sp. UYMn621]|uniref:hypothetical protein n=1 Tax=Frigoribacterium sp. UYMn621 TaxID=3156343 RepID=UPI0033960159
MTTITPIPDDAELDAITRNLMSPLLGRLTRKRRNRHRATVASIIGGLLAMFTIGVAVGGATLEPTHDAGRVLYIPAAQTYKGPVPNFTGPWGAEFSLAYRSTTSTAAHKVLAKGIITTADSNQLTEAYISCMAHHGFTATVDGPGGQGSISPTAGTPLPESAMNAAVGACDDGFAQVSALNYQILRNPQHLNENDIMAACLVREKVAPTTYTAADYAADLVSQKFSFNINSAAANKCITDPLSPGN